MSRTQSNEELADLLARYSPETQKLALSTRSLVLKLVPNTMELVDARAKVVGYGYGTKYADMICAIMPTKAGVTLGIARATELPDPEGLLQGTGKVHRHVKIKTEADLKSAALTSLLKAAMAVYKRSGTRQPPPVAT